MKVKEITAAIELVAPLHLQENYDNAGMQVGDPNSEVTGVVLCTDVREGVLCEAIALGANLIISHHPLIFKGIKKLTGASYVERIVMQAVKAGVNIYCAHTNLDNAAGGVSFKMAEKLGMTDVQFLDLHDNQEAGCGVIGNIAPMPAMDFLKQLKLAFEVHTVRYSGDTQRLVSRVALCGGAGSFLAGKAMAMGAHVFVSGDMKYHEFMGNEDQIILADIGHWESEHFTKEIFRDIILGLPTGGVPVVDAQSEQNQVKYL